VAQVYKHTMDRPAIRSRNHLHFWKEM